MTAGGAVPRRGIGAGQGLLLTILLACSSAGPQPPPVPRPGEAPFPTERGYALFVFASNGDVAGSIQVPDMIADPAQPAAFMQSVAQSFCLPILDESRPEPETRLLNYCRRTAAPEGGRRVVLAHSWSQAIPPADRCFVHCVCEGHVAAAGGRENLHQGGPGSPDAETGPCTNRLNCRLECPTD